MSLTHFYFDHAQKETTTYWHLYQTNLNFVDMLSFAYMYKNIFDCNLMQHIYFIRNEKKRTAKLFRNNVSIGKFMVYWSKRLCKIGAPLCAKKCFEISKKSTNQSSTINSIVNTRNYFDIKLPLMVVIFFFYRKHTFDIYVQHTMFSICCHHFQRFDPHQYILWLVLMF